VSPGQTAVRSLLDTVEPEVFLPALPLLDQIVADRYTRERSFAVEVLNRVRRSLPSEALVQGLDAGHERTRRVCARFLVERHEVSADALALALRQHDNVTASLIARAALDQLPDLESTLAALMASRSASLRALALVRYRASGSLQAPAAWEAALLDRSPGVRFLAQSHLGGAGVDVAQHYRDRLARQPVAVSGLGEVGETEDAMLVRPWLQR
jgi:HEAT repeat protein